MAWLQMNVATGSFVPFAGSITREGSTMTSIFDYDPEEIVSFEGHDISLKEAVMRYRRARAHPDQFTDFSAVRDPGKTPQVFDVEHFDALMTRPEFEDSA
ncbi:hypothetical protein [Labrys sp. ZIDIC5]|uniref:hypothetical protein n=1 Tax=Labrys sedimenti TaxID=3106036 RepID=UPI002ACA82F1|nr:hypothetical protein [Labrys sp. ZIDIC5]MDZ5453797.1 hypothetical protein [Labrys sp. ZIDIC5]